MISQLLAKKRKKKKEYILNTLGLRWWTESSVKRQGWSVQSISQRAALWQSSLMYWSPCVGCRCWAVNIAAWMTVNNQQAGVHHQQNTVLTEGHVWIDFKHKQAAGICFLYLPIDNITSLRLERHTRCNSKSSEKSARKKLTWFKLGQFLVEDRLLVHF